LAEVTAQSFQVPSEESYRDSLFTHIYSGPPRSFAEVRDDPGWLEVFRSLYGEWPLQERFPQEAWTVLRGDDVPVLAVAGFWLTAGREFQLWSPEAAPAAPGNLDPVLCLATFGEPPRANGAEIVFMADGSRFGRFAFAGHDVPATIVPWGSSETSRQVAVATGRIDSAGLDLGVGAMLARAPRDLSRPQFAWAVSAGALEWSLPPWDIDAIVPSLEEVLGPFEAFPPSDELGAAASTAEIVQISAGQLGDLESVDLEGAGVVVLGPGEEAHPFATGWRLGYLLNYVLPLPNLYLADDRYYLEGELRSRFIDRMDLRLQMEVVLFLLTADALCPEAIAPAE
jgi:hypothetical protein